MPQAFMTPLSTGSAAEQARYHPHAAGLAHREGESASERGSIFLPYAFTSAPSWWRSTAASRSRSSDAAAQEQTDQAADEPVAHRHEHPGKSERRSPRRLTARSGRRSSFFTRASRTRKEEVCR